MSIPTCQPARMTKPNWQPSCECPGRGWVCERNLECFIAAFAANFSKFIQSFRLHHQFSIIFPVLKHVFRYFSMFGSFLSLRKRLKNLWTSQRRRCFTFQQVTACGFVENDIARLVKTSFLLSHQMAKSKSGCNLGWRCIVTHFWPPCLGRERCGWGGKHVELTSRWMISELNIPIESKQRSKDWLVCCSSTAPIGYLMISQFTTCSTNHCDELAAGSCCVFRLASFRKNTRRRPKMRLRKMTRNLRLETPAMVFIYCSDFVVWINVDLVEIK